MRSRESFVSDVLSGKERASKNDKMDNQAEAGKGIALERVYYSFQEDSMQGFCDISSIPNMPKQNTLFLREDGDRSTQAVNFGTPVHPFLHPPLEQAVAGSSSFHQRAKTSMEDTNIDRPNAVEKQKNCTLCRGEIQDDDTYHEAPYVANNFTDKNTKVFERRCANENFTPQQMVGKGAVKLIKPESRAYFSRTDGQFIHEHICGLNEETDNGHSMRTFQKVPNEAWINNCVLKSFKGSQEINDFPAQQMAGRKTSKFCSPEGRAYSSRKDGHFISEHICGFNEVTIKSPSLETMEEMPSKVCIGDIRRTYSAGIVHKSDEGFCDNGTVFLKRNQGNTHFLAQQVVEEGTAKLCLPVSRTNGRFFFEHTDEIADNSLFVGTNKELPSQACIKDTSRTTAVLLKNPQPKYFVQLNGMVSSKRATHLDAQHTNTDNFDGLSNSKVVPAEINSYNESRTPQFASHWNANTQTTPMSKRSSNECHASKSRRVNRACTHEKHPLTSDEKVRSSDETIPLKRWKTCVNSATANASNQSGYFSLREPHLRQISSQASQSQTAQCPTVIPNWSRRDGLVHQENLSVPNQNPTYGQAGINRRSQPPECQRLSGLSSAKSPNNEIFICKSKDSLVPKGVLCSKKSQNLKVCDVDPAVKEKVEKFRLRKEKTVAAIVLKIVPDKLLVVIDEEHEDISIEDLREELPAHQPRYPFGHQANELYFKQQLLQGTTCEKLEKPGSYEKLVAEYIGNGPVKLG
ncbi:Glia maturation factor gamma [Stylophora pistillata]|uniref:Glia maturation factor gamma n=1 Tax=Stylophora pistillata TaxID=50429 RepID=A0A2B4RXI6_STYPI|nr:Glia maturation factor gamma [Stylophora pistillata]